MGMHDARSLFVTRGRENHGRFLVGQDGRGCWVLRDRLEQVGGIFVSRSAAYQFALRQAGDEQALIRFADNDEVIEPW
ncbi:hypothetical protein SAMN03159288_04606 [Rhizobium sp. NFACC06-2]|nr:hypothetical protein SAMN03159288_04606 [Rhizobium sp. NFACC06-2]